MDSPESEYRQLLARAEADPDVLAFWLGGSRSMGKATEYSDYDCCFVVAQDAYAAFKAELGLRDHHQMDWRPGIDLVAITFPILEAWPGRDYTFAHLKALVDKTGRAQPLIDAKGCVPEAEVEGAIHDALDHVVMHTHQARGRAGQQLFGVDEPQNLQLRVAGDRNDSTPIRPSWRRSPKLPSVARRRGASWTPPPAGTGRS